MTPADRGLARLGISKLLVPYFGAIVEVGDPLSALKLFPNEIINPFDTADKPVPLPEIETPLRRATALAPMD